MAFLPIIGIKDGKSKNNSVIRISENSGLWFGSPFKTDPFIANQLEIKPRARSRDWGEKSRRYLGTGTGTLILD